MTVIRAAERRRTATPNAVMTTLASPTQGAAGLALWRVDMDPGQVGPRHAFDTEQVWTVLTGAASVALGDQTVALGPGDTLVMPVDLPRQVTADPDAGLAAIVAAPAGSRASNPEGVTSADACALAPRDAERIVPPWVA
ncbi:Cupin domain protein [Streptoalloteichus tenebrarius]|uniref:Cupin domain protein n=1 Tax=Streptoalloteichus tenebrarius (strain ATCC 17920 / DSM 40477 / JCM 4838 / CBS 697.72 / NBRC 16177 / NCIMB 11028 / NRRL B-12390 / A12253. 1 / ISP 5477) TaxID=1933 RepID=A0ABT1I015_STRSD|nr:cupin domain-containing protein [Streptoalloteichus tenebrarius]MCP2261099.1 Cupin domain protein [Streptoalloteichus tenebrarius]